jgi:hypothetical protein
VTGVLVAASRADGRRAVLRLTGTHVADFEGPEATPALGRAAAGDRLPPPAVTRRKQ